MLQERSCIFKRANSDTSSRCSSACGESSYSQSLPSLLSLSFPPCPSRTAWTRVRFAPPVHPRAENADYAPRNWRYRWILLDGSLSTIYLCVFAAIAWLWRPTRDNVQFSMSQELAQDEAEADAEDFEIDALERGEEGDESIGMGHMPLRDHDEDDDDEEEADEEERVGVVKQNGRREVGEENVVFQMGEDSDDEEEASDRGAREDKKGDMDGDHRSDQDD